MRCPRQKRDSGAAESGKHETDVDRGLPRKRRANPGARKAGTSSKRQMGSEGASHSARSTCENRKGGAGEPESISDFDVVAADQRQDERSIDRILTLTASSFAMPRTRITRMCEY